MLHPLCVVIGVLFASALSTILVMQEANIERVSGTLMLKVIVGIPLMILCIIGTVSYAQTHWYSDSSKETACGQQDPYQPRY